MLDYRRCFGTRPIVALIEAANLPPRGVWEIPGWHFILGSIIGLCYIILHSWVGVALPIQATDAVHVMGNGLSYSRLFSSTETGNPFCILTLPSNQVYY